MKNYNELSKKVTEAIQRDYFYSTSADTTTSELTGYLYREHGILISYKQLFDILTLIGIKQFYTTEIAENGKRHNKRKWLISKKSVGELRPLSKARLNPLVARIRRQAEPATKPPTPVQVTRIGRELDDCIQKLATVKEVERLNTLQALMKAFPQTEKYVHAFSQGKVEPNNPKLKYDIVVESMIKFLKVVCKTIGENEHRTHPILAQLQKEADKVVLPEKLRLLCGLKPLPDNFPKGHEHNSYIEEWEETEITPTRTSWAQQIPRRLPSQPVKPWEVGREMTPEPLEPQPEPKEPQLTPETPEIPEDMELQEPESDEDWDW